MRIPVVVLTTSNADSDILATYGSHANCYITKPIDMDRFIEIVKLWRSFGSRSSSCRHMMPPYDTSEGQGRARRASLMVLILGSKFLCQQ